MMLNDSEFATLRNRFQKNAELLRQATTTSPGEDEKCPGEKDVRPLPRINKHSVFWIVASISVTYYVDFFRVIIVNNDIKSWWFNVGLLLLGICLCLATFCIVYLEWFRGIVHYDQEYPAIPPITTAAFIAASCSFNIALWPVWSFFTPLILFTQFMGVVMMISMLG
ncbi:transmembrane protein 128 isoform X1 [Phyllopteryx taeniolatus]|uniref:transmembrane protein 128 isoform X1 n=1 Tax=Phyllopteryx taeniolatus TaxID=161469 RepID=UPI002AD2F23A|nr:transmembrane protein 128 isoform X1 [Phyllopteryx taeniolatus]XP_061640902.1 transmembrane protein 128 isoform X1 [Phyllopteryx taeniolatus]